MKYLKGLDTLRALAIVIVIIAHWGPYGFKQFFLNFIFTKLRPEGVFGVDLFFVLSGYLITRILLHAREKTEVRARLKIIKNFYIRRALRIFPIYFLFVLILAYVLNDGYTRNNIGYFLTYTTNFLLLRDGRAFVTHTWSLAVEEQFYLIWPWVIIYTPPKYLFAVILSSIFIGFVSTLLFNHIYGFYGTYLLLPCITAFATGGLYAYVETHTRFRRIIVVTIKIFLPVCLILLLVQQFGQHMILIRAVNSVIGVAAVIFITKQNYNAVFRYMLNNRITVNIGKISYGLYLYHLHLPRYYYKFIEYCQKQIKIDARSLKILTIPPSAYVIYLSLLFIIAALSYRYVEQFFLRLKTYFSYT